MSEQKNIFRIATMKGYRFNYYRGSIQTEDLWDLSVEDLDGIYKNLSKELKETEQGDSLLNKSSAKNEDLANKIEIIKDVVEYKLEMAKKAQERNKNRQLKQTLLTIKKQKELEQYNDMDLDKLEEMINSIE